MFRVYLYMKFQIYSSTGSLVAAIKPKAEKIFEQLACCFVTLHSNKILHSQ